MTARFLAVIGKGAHDEVRVEVMPYNGADYLGIRIFDLYGARSVPTTKGLTLPVTMLPKLIQTLQNAQTAITQPAPISANFGEGGGHADGN